MKTFKKMACSFFIFFLFFAPGLFSQQPEDLENLRLLDWQPKACLLLRKQK